MKMLLLVCLLFFSSIQTFADDEFPGSDSFQQINTSNPKIQLLQQQKSNNNDNEQFPGDENYPQMNGVKHKPEPEFPGSNSFGNIKENYPKGILPSAPTRTTNAGGHFINTLGNSTPNSFPGSENFPDSEAYQGFIKRKQFRTFEPRKVQFPGSNSFPNDETYKPWISTENDIEVNAGGYTSPYYLQQKKQKEENLKKAKQTLIESEKKKEQEELKHEKEEKLENTLPPDKGMIQAVSTFI